MLSQSPSQSTQDVNWTYIRPSEDWVTYTQGYIYTVWLIPPFFQITLPTMEIYLNWIFILFVLLVKTFAFLIFINFLIYMEMKQMFWCRLKVWPLVFPSLQLNGLMISKYSCVVWSGKISKWTALVKLHVNSNR